MVLNDETTDIGHDRTEHVKNDETITIDNDRLENVKHNETITIDNDRTETVKNDERITIENDRIELVKNDETVTIENDQHKHIKKNQYEDVDGDKHNKVRGDRLEKITGSSHLKITGSQNEEITQSVSRDTKMNVQEKMGMKYAVDAGTEVHLKAGLSAVIEATASITLQVGESVININPAGVFIDGPIVLIKSGAIPVPGTGSNPDGADDAENANRAVSRDNPNTEDIEYDGTVGGDNARHPLETEAAPPEIGGDDAIDFTVEPPEPELPEAEADDGFGVDDTVSLGLDFVPVVGSGKSIAQLISGTDLITGEPTPRWIEAVGILAGVFGAAGIAKGILKGGSSVLKHGDEVADVAKIVKKSDKTNDAAKAAKRADKATDAAKNLSGKNQKLFDDIYAKAPDAKREIDDLADEIASSVDGKVAKAPIKSKERAVEKIINDYDGDPTRIKDLARNTIVTSDGNIDSVVSQLSKKGADVKIIDGNKDPLGYSGVNTTVKTNSGLTGEIQVNTPEMIYAKESEPMARVLIGDDAYSAISSKTDIPGGKGHEFYEEWRSLPDSDPKRLKIETESKAYYEAIRGTTNGN